MAMNPTSSSDDEDAPEAFSLAQSKRNAATQDDALKKFQAKEKHRQKERNRERDRKLKERALKTKGTKVLEEWHGVQARMERVMRDAEDDEDEDGSESEEDTEGNESEASSEESEDHDMSSAAGVEPHAMQSHSDNDEKSQDETAVG